MKRFIIIVLDGFGVGYTADAHLVRPQDVGANTCKHILERLPTLHLPNLERLGLMNAVGQAVGGMKPSVHATWGTSGLAHFGADTFYGHQELMGTKPRLPEMLPFSACISVVHTTLQAAGFTVEEIGTGARFLLVEGCVTVADNIEADPGQAFNVTGALDQISFERIVTIGRAVRSVVPVSRVIALGGEGIMTADLLNAAEEKSGYIGINCPRSGVYNSGYRVIHLGYGVDPATQVPSLLGQMGITTTLIGKVADIVANPAGESIPCIDTATVLTHTVAAMDRHQTAFITANVQETDLAGHAENVDRYASVLTVADAGIGPILQRLSDQDILVVMADHGNDPTVGHNHHTREYVPLLFAGPGLKPGPIGSRSTMSDVGATVADFFHCSAPEHGASFLSLLR